MKKAHKKSALTNRLTNTPAVKMPTVISDARVLNLRGPRPGVVVTVPLDLLPQWYELHRVDVVEKKSLYPHQALVTVKRIAQ
jgi:hypothetical protein